MVTFSSSLFRAAAVLVLALLLSHQYRAASSSSATFVSAQTEGKEEPAPPNIFTIVFYILVEMFNFVKIRTVGPSCSVLPTIPDFDLNKFIEKSWYVQTKQVNEYQDYSELNCITETYDFYPTGQLTSDLYKLQMVKYLRGQGGTGPTGPEFVVDWMCLTPWGEGGQFKNVPCLFPGFLKFLGGPYWVVKTDYTSYAIIVGGALTERGLCDDTSKLCTVPIRGELFDPGSWFGQRQGLYFFTRALNPPPELIKSMDAMAKEMGICTASMLDVIHEGCVYTENAKLKL